MTIALNTDLAHHLLAAPSPLPQESCASWIQRIACAHQYSMARLVDVLELNPPSRDWDSPFSQASWSRLCMLAGLKEASHLASLQLLEKLLAKSNDRSLLRERGRPYSRWCGCCLQSDKLPYFRWHWRLGAVSECWVHRTQLRSRCPTCGALAWFDRTRLVACGRSGKAFTLAECDVCRAPLHEVTPSRHSRGGAHQKALRINLTRLLTGSQVRSDVDVGCEISNLLDARSRLRHLLSRSKRHRLEGPLCGEVRKTGADGRGQSREVFRSTSSERSGGVAP